MTKRGAIREVSRRLGDVDRIIRPFIFLNGFSVALAVGLQGDVQRRRVAEYSTGA